MWQICFFIRNSIKNNHKCLIFNSIFYHFIAIFGEKFTFIKMIFTFKNIGVVANAQIEIKGLTVITGLNDTGKSFISKSIYSTFLTLKEGSDQWFQIKLSRQIDPLIRNINVLLQGTPIPIFFNSITNFRNQIVNSFISKLPLESINPIIDSKKTELFNILQNAPNISSEIKEQVTKKLDVLFQLLQSEEGEEDKYISFFDEIIVKPLFRGQINTLYPDHEKLEIIGKEGDVEVFNIEIENNKTTRFKANNQQYYTDASLIDTPMLIHFQNIIISFGLRQSVALRGDVGVPNYYFDLANKIRPLQPVPPQLLDIYESIQKIINGKMIFNVEKNNYIYEKDNGHRIESNNTASGVKSFGLIQLLLNAGMIILSQF